MPPEPIRSSSAPAPYKGPSVQVEAWLLQVWMRLLTRKAKFCSDPTTSMIEPDETAALDVQLFVA